MGAAVFSFLGRWRVRWFARAVAAPPLAARPRDEPGTAEVEAPGAGQAGSRTAVAVAVEPSVRETAKIEATALAIEGAKPATADSALRARTLEALKNLKQIPALQSLAEAFQQMSAKTDVAVEDVVSSIRKDSALCVRVLGMANSVGVGSELPVDDLATAVHLLGVVRVRRMAQALFTLRDSQRMAEGLDWRHPWVHAFATAAIAEELEKRLRSAGGSDGVESPVHLAGLLHDVGKIVLSTVAPETYREIMAAAWNGEGRLEALECARLGVTHREAGAIFAEHQRLPAVVVAAIAHHGEPDAADEGCRSEVALVTLANFLSKAHGLGFSGARLEESDGEFAELSAWRVLAEAGTRGARAEEIEEELAGFVAGLRVELRALREGV